MATAVIMPRQGQSVESCIITHWEKQVGDAVRPGDLLFSYETDKAAFDEEAKEEGVLLAILRQEQDDVPCLEPVAVIGQPGEDVSAWTGGAAGAEEAPPARESTGEAAERETPAPHPTEAAGVSPRARNTARRLGVDLSAVSPTGPRGRILERDVLSACRASGAVLRSGRSTAGVTPESAGNRVTLADFAPEGAPGASAAPAAASPAPAAGYRDVPLSHLRKVIAKSMQQSLATMAQLTHHTSFDVSSVAAFRRELKAFGGEELQGVTYNDILLFAVSRVLKAHPDLNAHYLEREQALRYFDHVHLGMAVDTPRGLLVPTIFNADEKSLAEISREAKALAGEAQSGAISPDLLTGASFTVTNLGALGIELFTPVINPPQTGILGVDCIADRVRRGADGGAEVYPAMGLSLTYDHRALDGAPASRFLKELKTALEHFSVFLAK